MLIRNIHISGCWCWSWVCYLGTVKLDSTWGAWWGRLCTLFLFYSNRVCYCVTRLVRGTFERTDGRMDVRVLVWVGGGLIWGLDWIGLDWIGLDWIELVWIGLDWFGLMYIYRMEWMNGFDSIFDSLVSFQFRSPPCISHSLWFNLLRSWLYFTLLYSIQFITAKLSSPFFDFLAFAFFPFCCWDWSDGLIRVELDCCSYEYICIYIYIYISLHHLDRWWMSEWMSEGISGFVDKWVREWTLYRWYC